MDGVNDGDDRDGTVVVRVLPGPDTDGEDLADLAQSLRGDLLDLDVEDVAPLTDADVPQGAKGLGTVAGGMLVRIGVSAALRSVVAAVKRWTARDAARSVEIQFGDDVLRVTGVTAQRQEELIEVWLERHRSGA
ncbi:hypothetical protein [Streptomyces sp. RFCAC02]|uniref:hypothetical protein n=1 Tax=Streptomyces sp. RFCAC02 TaxID=2499143 RepID=UPI001020F472|nr:hypothetical protein [Streptomyces sp. RFCAC02]